jgi:hypothetical protein
MKRLLVVILSLVYFAASSGFTLRQHYCMGEMIGAAIDAPMHHDDSHHCDRCGMEKKSSDDNGCCEDQVKTFKASPDQLPAKAVEAPAMAMIALLPPAFIIPEAPHSPASLPQIAAAPPHGPPGITSELPVYLQVRCLRL